MDAAVSQILQLSKKSDWAALRKWLDGHLDQLRRASGGAEQALQALDLQKHTMGACYILFAKCQADKDKAVDPGFLDTIETFFASLNAEQIRDHCADRFGVIGHRYAEGCRQTKRPGRGIAQLLQALTNLRPNPDYLTPLHADYICLCLLEKQYSLARRVLDCTIFEIKPSVTGVTPRDMLLYYYYGSMIWLGLRMYDRAHSFLETCITVPATVLSAIVVEAYKKYVIVSLIVKQRLHPLPKHCSSAVTKAVKRYCQEYCELAEKWEKREAANISEIIERHRKVYQDDKNWGLVQQAQKAFTRQAISRLTTTYDTLSLKDIAQNTGVASPAAAEALLVEMVEQGQLSCRINERDGMVTFVSAETTDLYSRMSDGLERLQKMAQRIETMDESVQVSREYNHKLMLRDPNFKDEISQMGAGKKKGGLGSMVGALADAFKG